MQQAGFWRSSYEGLYRSYLSDLTSCGGLYRSYLSDLTSWGGLYRSYLSNLMQKAQYYCWTSQRSHWSFVQLELNKLRTVFTSRIGVNTASDYTDDIPSSFKVSIDFQGDPS
uniref:Uncharacterized protein n=1 Tax=Timema genevievae TaxID=629358 RepID=A0A7R9JRD2_TIMGE|nr:unnamed protein product [Timema genevievae]